MRGDFVSKHVPPGEYVVSLNGMGRAIVASEKITVTANQTVEVRLVMVSSSVQLTIKVPRGLSQDLVIERLNDTTGEPVSRGISRRDDKVLFADVEPGGYRISLDGATWTPITVAAEPPEQTIDVLGAS